MGWAGERWASVCGGKGEGWGHPWLGPPSDPPPIPYGQGIMGGVVGIMIVKGSIQRVATSRWDPPLAWAPPPPPHSTHDKNTQAQHRQGGRTKEATAAAVGRWGRRIRFARPGKERGGAAAAAAAAAQPWVAARRRGAASTEVPPPTATNTIGRTLKRVHDCINICYESYS